MNPELLEITSHIWGGGGYILFALVFLASVSALFAFTVCLIHPEISPVEPSPIRLPDSRKVKKLDNTISNSTIETPEIAIITVTRFLGILHEYTLKSKERPNLSNPKEKSVKFYNFGKDFRTRED